MYNARCFIKLQLMAGEESSISRIQAIASHQVYKNSVFRLYDHFVKTDYDMAPLNLYSDVEFVVLDGWINP